MSNVTTDKFLRNVWYPVAWEREIGGGPHAPAFQADKAETALHATGLPLVPAQLVEFARQLLRDSDVLTDAGGQVAVYRCTKRTGEWYAQELPTEQTVWLGRQETRPT